MPSFMPNVRVMCVTYIVASVLAGKRVDPDEDLSGGATMIGDSALWSPDTALEHFIKSTKNGWYTDATCCRKYESQTHEQCAQKCLDYGIECGSFEVYLTNPGTCYIFTKPTETQLATCGWQAVSDCKYYERTAAPTAAPTCNAEAPAHDPGAPARCIDTTECTPTGQLECVASQKHCTTNHGFVSATDKCKAYFGNPVRCPDGVGISPLGVFMSTNYSDGESTKRRGFCCAWDSDFTALGIQTCTEDYGVCTKAYAGHIHGMSLSAGIFVMNRTRCINETCSTSKVGRCFDVGEDVFTSRWNSEMATTLVALNQAWNAKALAMLRAGTATSCSSVPEGGFVDLRVGNSAILSY